MALSNSDKKDIIEATVKGILDHLKGVLQETRSSTPGGSGLNPSMSIDLVGGTATPNSAGTVGADNPLQQPGRMMIFNTFLLILGRWSRVAPPPLGHSQGVNAPPPPGKYSSSRNIRGDLVLVTHSNLCTDIALIKAQGLSRLPIATVVGLWKGVEFMKALSTPGLGPTESHAKYPSRIRAGNQPPAKTTDRSPKH